MLVSAEMPTHAKEPGAPALLRRIRVGDETQTGPKRVWHRSDDGLLDLLTDVDEQGRATFQELSLPGLLVRWRDGRVVTGRERARGAKWGRAGGSDLVFDSSASAETLDAALALIDPGGDDRYVTHLLETLRAARNRIAAEASDTVTAIKPVGRPAGTPAAPTLWERLRGTRRR